MSEIESIREPRCSWCSEPLHPDWPHTADCASGYVPHRPTCVVYAWTKQSTPCDCAWTVPAITRFLDYNDIYVAVRLFGLEAVDASAIWALIHHPMATRSEAV